MGRHRAQPAVIKRPKPPKELPMRKQFCWVCAGTVHSSPAEPKPVKCHMCGSKLDQPQWGKGGWQ